MSFNTQFSADVSAAPRHRSSLPSWWHEPLLQFLLIGVLLFGIDQWLLGREEDPSTIIVTSEVVADSARLFSGARGQSPDADEVHALRQLWLDNEVLYREGLAMGLDRGDSAIRERVIFKMLSLIDSDLQVPEISDAELRAWFEARREKYDEPARYDFDEAVVESDRSEAAVRALVARLDKAGGAGDSEASLRVFTGRPRASLVQTYGEAFAAALDTVPPQRWQALLTKDGWRAIRIKTRTAVGRADFDALRGPVLQDWRDAKAAELRTAAVRKLASRYTIRDEAGAAAR